MNTIAPERAHTCVPLQYLAQGGSASWSRSSGVEWEPVATSGRFLPREDWQPEESLAPTSISSALPLDSAVTILDLGSDLVADFRAQLPMMLDAASVVDGVRATWLSRFGETVAERLHTRGILAESVRVCNVAINPPGIRSTGRDFVTNTYVGLHIDNHDRLTLQARQGAIQLLAMNCGASARYLHYIDLPVHALAAMTNTDLDSPDEDRRVACDRLKNRFCEQYPDYPVTRVVLPPGHAYIATPQNIIHDGAGASGSSADVAFLRLGRYRTTE